jgi:hypothetical protein
MRGKGIKQVGSGEIKDIYFRAFDLTSVMERNGIKQVSSAKKNAAAPKKVFASRFPKKVSRTNAKFAILKSPSKRGV